jgi:hypothetical protein
MDNAFPSTTVSDRRVIEESIPSYIGSFLFRGASIFAVLASKKKE